MTIDRLLPDPWDPDTLASLERWRQGHLLKMDRGAWIVPDWVDDPVTGERSAGGAVGKVRARSAPLSDTGYTAVVSQTCDIAGGPGPRHPLVQACPVRDISGFPPDKIQQIKDHQVSEYVWLSQPPVDGVTWADPKRMRLLVLTDRPLEVSEKKPLRDEWKSHKKVLKADGINWEPIRFLTVDKCPVRLYRATVHIEVPTLDRGRFT